MLQVVAKKLIRQTQQIGIWWYPAAESCPTFCSRS